jgi:hypothetical protein
MTKFVTRAELDRGYHFACGLLEKGPIDWLCAPWKETRTSGQNRLLFGVVYPPIADATGYEIEGENGLHAFMCGTHFGWVDKKVPKTPNNPKGVASFPFRTTTRDEKGKYRPLKKDEFSKFLATVERIAAKAGVFVPLERAA